MRIRFAAALGFSVAALLLAGCSGGSRLLTGKETVPGGNVPVGNNLAIPPDLQLQPPTGTAVDAYQPNGPVAPVNPPPAAPTKMASIQASKPSATDAFYGSPGTAANPPPQDIFAQYNISKTKPDGTLKTPVELNRELGAAIKKKRQETNPKYGTIANIGAIFGN